MSNPGGRINQFLAQLQNILSSQLFFYLTLLFFTGQAFWQALVVRFPAAFDEATHLAIIKYFSSHPNPFFSQQPAYLDQYGVVAHDPSYLSRYLMAPFWHFITFITDNFTTQIVFMRSINTIFFIIGLVLFRKLLLKVTKNHAVVNIALLLTVLTPIAGQLASQINYDNLLLPLMAGSLLVAVKLVENLKQGKLNLWLLVWFILLSTLALLTKYTYITIFVAIIFYVSWHFIKFRHQLKRTELVNSLHNYSRWQLIALVVVFIISFGLLFERYGLNLARYHTINPNCVQVIGEQRCQNFSIYQRGIIYAQNKPNYINKDPILFTYRWLKHMNFNLMMSLSGPDYGYSVGMPLPVPFIASIIFGVGGLVLSAIYWRNIFKNTAARLLIFSLGIYAIALWFVNYIEYAHTGRRVAVQGRYLVIFLPFLYTIFLLGFKYLLAKWPRTYKLFVVLVIIAFMMGGGAATFILHSDDNWVWPNTTFIEANDNLRQVLRHTIPPWQTDYKPYWQDSLSF